VKTPSNVVLLGDSGKRADEFSDIYKSAYYLIDNLDQSHRISRRHDNGSNLGFADGHVERMNYLDCKNNATMWYPLGTRDQ
jgi:prepilin-type processing-associated H-X9-DG protein